MAIRIRGTDWALAIVCALVALAGPLMAVQEYARQVDADALARLTGEAPALELEFRAPWRLALLAGVVAIGVLGTIVALRVSWRPRVRAVSGRLLTLLLLGMTVLDFAFIADARWFPGVGYEARALTTVWPYTIGALVTAGALLRIAEVEQAFARD